MGKAIKNPIKCMDCKKILNTRDRYVERCWECFMEWRTKNYIRPKNWKGGWLKPNGYRLIYVKGRGHQNRMLEHRHIMEQHLGRELQQNEIVHHLNGIKHDNRIENLALTNREEHEHNTFTRQLQKRIMELETRLNFLEKSNHHAHQSIPEKSITIN